MLGYATSRNNVIVCGMLCIKIPFVIKCLERCLKRAWYLYQCFQQVKVVLRYETQINPTGIHTKLQRLDLTFKCSLIAIAAELCASVETYSKTSQDLQIVIIDVAPVSVSYLTSNLFIQ